MSGDWLTPPWEASGREYTARKAQIEATERRLRSNPAALRAFHADEARKLSAAKANYQAAHPSSGCLAMTLGLLGLGVVFVALALSLIVTVAWAPVILWRRRH